MICVASFIAPHDEVRQKAKHLAGADCFFHIHLSTPLEVCRQRDQSGIYAAADKGEVVGIAGVDRPYETPTDADFTISLAETSVEEIIERTVKKILNARK